jgi:hypothetical protein
MNRELINKAKVNYFITDLPEEIQRVIFEFAPPTIANGMKHTIDIYNKDYYIENAPGFNMYYDPNVYYIRDILPFVDYIYDSNSVAKYGLGTRVYNNNKQIYFTHGWLEWLMDKDNENRRIQA